MYWRLSLTKRLLAKIVRTEVRDHPPETNAARLYVLPRVSLTDLAVVKNAIKRAAPGSHDHCEFLHQEIGFLRRRSVMREYPERLSGAHLFAALGGRIEIVPVSVFWSRSPAYETSTTKLLLSERWTATSRLRRFFEVMVNRKQVQVVYAPPLDLAQLLRGQSVRDRALRRTARLLRVIFKNQRLALLGPELSLKRRALASVLSQPEVRLAIERRAVAEGRHEARIAREARHTLRAMVSDFSAITLRLVYRFAHWCWHWSGTEFDIRGLEAVRQRAQTTNLVYLPCHQSHLDYIALSYILYDRGLALPHIASGDNLNLPILGKLLRHCGAFFIRRRFRDDDLYRSLITHYLRLILVRGHPVEFFLEGTRSRSGFLMPARLGMLQVAMNASSATHSLPARPIAWVPVRYAYERVLDGESYARERSGAAKRGESWLDPLRSLLRLRQGLGRIGVAFGEPVALEAGNALSLEALAEDMLRRINRQLMVTSTHLLGLVFAGKYRLETRLALSQIRVYINLLEAGGFEVLAGDPQRCIEAGLKQGLVYREHFAGANWVSVTDKGGCLLPWHRNNALHGLAFPALASLQLRTRLALAPLKALFGHMFHVDIPSNGDFQQWQALLEDQPGRIETLLRPLLEHTLLVLGSAQDRPSSIVALIAESLRRASRLAGVLTEPLAGDNARLIAHALISASVINEQSDGISPLPHAKPLSSAILACLGDQAGHTLTTPV